jgi:hypothetical protein
MVGTNGKVGPNLRLVSIEYILLKAMDETHNLRSAKHWQTYIT